MARIHSEVWNYGRVKVPVKKVLMYRPVVYVRHAETTCSDCGKLGCLNPITHKQLDRLREMCDQ